MIENEDKLYDETDNLSEDQGFTFNEYDITAAPNDFNIKTLVDFISSGIVKIPGFQRNYVWDIKRASKLIESIILGIPIPQIFLYQEEKNKFIVIDGQQRYMTIYYFLKKRFPINDKRYELRKIFDESEKGIPENILNDDKYFIDFNLMLPEKLPEQPNPLNKKNYFTLDNDLKTTLELRTIRNVIIKENIENKKNSAIYEIFNRLNSGGINLTPQEIRTSLYHSEFYKMLYNLNLYENWRKITPQTIPDLHMKDIEIILRAFAILLEKESYKPSMTKFLNKFSHDSKEMKTEEIIYLEQLFKKFIDNYSEIGKDIFYGKNNRFTITIFESIFYFSCITAYKNNNLDIKLTTLEKINLLKEDKDYINAILDNTASTKSINTRLLKALEMLK